MATATVTQFAELKPEELSWCARRASIAIRKQLVAIQTGIEALPTPGELPDVEKRNQLAPIASTLLHDKVPSDTVKDQTYKVGIVGAGCAGLFTGLIFDHLKAVYGLNVDFEILEASGNQRLGGRLYTHYFSDQPHDYYDVGAMRFPASPIMKRVFDMFENELDMQKKPSTDDTKPGDLVPYYLTGINTTELFNDINIKNPEGKSQSTANTFEITGLPPDEANQRPSDIIEAQVGQLLTRLKTDPSQGWKDLLSQGDSHSVRQWLLDRSVLIDICSGRTSEHFHDPRVSSLTGASGTSWYDEALTEMVLEQLTFSWDGDWFCVMGGSQEIAKRMFKKLETKQTDRVQFGKKVTEIYRLLLKDGTTSGKLAVQVAGESKSREYDAVFNSAPLGNMQRMDLRGLNLNWGTKQAIRSLGYGASCKIGISFSKLWWIDMGIKKGGVSKTDLPIRNCVYPSYNIGDPTNKPGVLLASYTWSQEAQRIATLINSSDGEAELKALLIDNLARLHSSTPDEYDTMKDMITRTYVSHYAYDWYTDEGTTGAFAYFGPGQFSNMYPYIIRNDGTHIIIGEAASAHHAWVVGALESAVRGVYQFLYHRSHDPKVSEVLQAYNENKVVSPYGPIPAEFDRTTDVIPLGVKDEKLEGVSAVGEWLRQGVLAEEIRLRQGGDRLDTAKVKAEDVSEFLTVKSTA
ncbi:MAG: hypothetical protein Q9218_003007 [Villophora microphyllina]